MNKIIEIFKQFKYKLLLIYFFMFVSQVIFLLEPYYLGKTIDGLIKNEYDNLFILITIYLAASSFVFKRMIYDTKVYTEIYNYITLNYLKNNPDETASKKVARADMGNEVVNVLEGYVDYYINTIITIIGSLYLLIICF